MTVTIYNNNKTTLTAVFDPAHREAITKFYNDLMNAGQIWNWTMSR